jgi:hypothetical protein
LKGFRIAVVSNLVVFSFWIEQALALVPDFPVPRPVGVYVSIQRGWKLIYPRPQRFWICHAPDAQ